MATDPKPAANEDREAIESNVRRMVGITALRRIHRLIDERAQSERVLRNVIAPIAVLLMIVVAALIWKFGSPRMDDSAGPLPECAPPRSQNVST